MSANRFVFTIGHSTHSLEDFMSLLQQNQIEVVADVRSAPYSRYQPHFNKDVISRDLRANGIKYVFLGKELGGRPEDPSCYGADGRARYSELAKQPQFREGLERLKRGIASYRVALMCAERDPLKCHRTFFVARALNSDGVSVEHILADGTAETHKTVLESLLEKKAPQSNLFGAESAASDNRVGEALDRQAARFAYKISGGTDDRKESAT